MNITILLPGFGLPSAIIGPYEVFSSAGTLWDQLQGQDTRPLFEVTTASIDGKPVRYAGGVTITPDKPVAAIRNTDLIFVPTIGLDQERVFARNQGMIRFLARHAERGTLIAGVCTGVSMLAEAGVLDNREATTHWALAGKYSEQYPNVDWKPERFITAEDNICCGGGVYASLDLCLYLVERLAGYDTARKTGQALLIDSPRKWQSSFSAPLLNQQHRDEKVQEAQQFLHDNFNTSLTIDELSRRLGMSSRNFNRRFKQATGETPLNYLHKLRINCAKQLLETDYKSVQEVCFDVGYEDVPFFRSVFRRYTGLSPREYKQRFGASLATLDAS